MLIYDNLFCWFAMLRFTCLILLLDYCYLQNVSVITPGGESERPDE